MRAPGGGRQGTGEGHTPAASARDARALRRLSHSTRREERASSGTRVAGKASLDPRPPLRSVPQFPGL